MAKTPEARVKEKIKKLLKWVLAWSFMPVSNGLGKHGVCDHICCVPVKITPAMVGKKFGLFVGIEAKATEKHKPTPRQDICMREIREAGGITLVIHKDNLDTLEKFLRSTSHEII